MKRILLTVYFLLVVLSSYAQQKIGIKIYQNTDLFNTEYFSADEYYGSRNKSVTESDRINFTRFSLALDINTKKNLTHEIEFFIPEIKKSTDKIQFPLNYEFKNDNKPETDVSAYSIRYEVSKNFSNQSSRFSFNVGLGINPYHVRVEYPQYKNIYSYYYTSTKLYGAALSITPRIKYKLANRFSIDLNIPLKIYDVRREKRYINNPNIPLYQQTHYDVHNIFLEKAYTIRLGLLYYLK